MRFRGFAKAAVPCALILALAAPFAERGSAKGQTLGADNYVPCPIAQAKTQVTDNVPGPWWQTPQVGSVVGTKIMNIGGTPTLVCQYWAYGKTTGVMRKFPQGKTDCQPQGKGFVCQ